jgi:hypothetical protein
MSKVVDLGRVRRALATLDGLVRRFPRLVSPAAQERLANCIDDEEGTDDHGDRNGDQAK